MRRRGRVLRRVSQGGGGGIQRVSQDAVKLREFDEKPCPAQANLSGAGAITTWGASNYDVRTEGGGVYLQKQT